MRRLLRTRGALLAGAGVVASAIGVLDPRFGAGLWLGPLFAGLALLARPATDVRRLLAILALAFSIAGFARPEFRADAGSYFVYLRSLAFDQDLDFANDWTLLGHPPKPSLRTATGYISNSQTLGPALVWSPFYAVTHLYVRMAGALGLASWPANGVSEPYRGALALGTVTAVVLAALLLGRLLASDFGSGVAALAVGVTLFASPAVYYTFVVPGMAHGLGFALAAGLVVALVHARRSPSLGAWLTVGAVLGLLVLVRTQAGVMGLLVLPVAFEEWRRGRARLVHLVAAGAVALAVFLPQTLAWKAIFGAYLTVPQGRGYLDWSSPHLADVLFSANHGLFATSPVSVLGLVGLLLYLRRDLLLAGGSLLAFAALAWTNGAVTDWDWEGGDAFGARRFDVALPLFALGLAGLIKVLRDLAARRPIVLPAFALGLLAVWNLGWLTVFRGGGYPEAAPLDRVASDQALLFRRVVTGSLGAFFGARGRAAAYDVLAGEYLFGTIGRDGSLNLAAADDRTIGSGFSPPTRREDGPGFRWALYPEACLTLPLRGDLSLTAVGLFARAPRRAQPQTVTLVLNDTERGRSDLGTEWTALRFAVPAEAFLPGENRLCLRFARGLPGEGEDRPAAAVAEVRLTRRLEDLGSTEPLNEQGESPEP